MSGQTETTLLYSGPVDETLAVLPVGEYYVFAEIHENAGAYARSEITPSLTIYMPDQKEYEEFNIQQKLAYYGQVGDQARLTQMLAADVSGVNR